MTGIGVMSSIRPLSADIIHNLVLALPRDAGIRDDNLELGIGEPSRRGKNKCVTHLLPTRVAVQLLDDPISQRLGQKLHERRAWRNGIRIPGLPVFFFFTYSLPHRWSQMSIWW